MSATTDGEPTTTPRAEAVAAHQAARRRRAPLIAGGVGLRLAAAGALSALVWLGVFWATR